MQSDWLAATRASPKCERATKVRNVSVTKVCSACRTALTKFASYDRAIRNNRSCFPAKDYKKYMNAMAEQRSKLNFMRRGCGY